ncbi:MAG TPA: SDR family NAD(P)-dependent oxidoreductase [Candidatus Acidoferrales bacterium]|nr:SDR family NAD(P)-dependent oxidoreductase [Candidatus Acidoferrales bacterium]
MALRFQHAIVVGASSGIGAAIARELAASGAAVALLGRRADELERVAAPLRASARAPIVTVVHDVTAVDTVPALFERLVGELGGLDLLVYAAGQQVMAEEGVWDFARDLTMLDVNAAGAIVWTSVAAARFEARRAGTILGLSSIAGERGRRTMPGYTTSKAALTTWLEALRNRVSRSGVNVVTIKPGYVDTALTRDLAFKPMMISAGRAAAIALATARRGGSPSAFVPARWWLVAMMLRHLPSRVFRRLNF